MVWLLGKTELPHNSTILLPAMYPEQMKAESQRCICIPMFIEELFTIATKWNKVKCLSMD